MSLTTITPQALNAMDYQIQACKAQRAGNSDLAEALLKVAETLLSQRVQAAPVKTTSVVRVVESEPVEEKPSTPGHYYASKSKGYRDGLKASFGAVKPSPSPELVKVKTKPEPSPSPELIPTKGLSWERVYTLAIGKRIYRVSTRTNSQANRYVRIDLVSGRRAKADTFLDGLRVCSAGKGSRKSCWQGSYRDWTELKAQFPVR